MLSTGERSRNQPVRVAKQLLDAARFWFLHSLDPERTCDRRYKNALYAG
jgi:hypothetical protein